MLEDGHATFCCMFVMGGASRLQLKFLLRFRRLRRYWKICTCISQTKEVLEVYVNEQKHSCWVVEWYQYSKMMQGWTFTGWPIKPKSPAPLTNLLHTKEADCVQLFSFHPLISLLNSFAWRYIDRPWRRDCLKMFCFIVLARFPASPCRCPQMNICIRRSHSWAAYQALH